MMPETFEFIGEFAARAQALGIDLADGVVRVSAVHYNTADEIDRVLAVLRTLA